MKYGFWFLLLWLFVSCDRIKVNQKDKELVLETSKTVVTMTFSTSLSPEQVAFYAEVFRRLTRIEKPVLSVEIRGTGDPYQDTFLLGNVLFKDWKNLTLRWAWIQQIWETMRWRAETSSSLWSSFLREEMISYARVKDFEALFRKYKLNPLQIQEARKYLIQFLSVEVYFVSLQELMERYGRYYTMSDLSTVFFQVVVLPESVEWLEFLQKRYGTKIVSQIAKIPYDKEIWAKKLGKPISDLESEFVRGLENKKFTKGIWKNLDFVHEYQNLLSLYNKATKPILFKK